MHIWGKLAFITCDLLVGILISEYSLMGIMLWWGNLFVVGISTRGSSESLICLFVMASLRLLSSNKHGRLELGSFVYGVCVHLKIYPIIYSVPTLFYLACRNGREDVRRSSRLQQQKRNSINWISPLKFTIISASTFLVLGYLMYIIYGQDFIDETYLYHVIRKDHRHNYSLYFYNIYLNFNNVSGLFDKLLWFLPQFLLVFGLSALSLKRFALYEVWFYQT